MRAIFVSPSTTELITPSLFVFPLFSPHFLYNPIPNPIYCTVTQHTMQVILCSTDTAPGTVVCASCCKMLSCTVLCLN